MTMHQDLASLPMVELAPADFTQHFITEQTSLTTGQRNEPLRLGMASRPDRSLRLVLVDGGRVLHTLIPGAAVTAEPEVREVIIDSDAACELILEYLAEKFPAELAAATDKVAASILQDLIAQRADVADAVWLTHFIRYRGDAPRLGPDEACRLFGSAPEVSLTRDGCAIEWTRPGEIIGPDAEFERRKAIAQKVAAHEIDEAIAKFAGSVHAAFLHAFLRRTDHTPSKGN